MRPTLPKAPERDPHAILKLLADRGVDVVDWEGWVGIDEAEIALGQAQGRERVKIAQRLQLLNHARRLNTGDAHGRLSGGAARPAAGPRLSADVEDGLDAVTGTRGDGGVSVARLLQREVWVKMPSVAIRPDATSGSSSRQVFWIGAVVARMVRLRNNASSTWNGYGVRLWTPDDRDRATRAHRRECGIERRVERRWPR